MATLSPVFILSLLDYLSGLVPVGFTHAELCFEKDASDECRFTHVVSAAPPEAPMLNDLLDPETCRETLSVIGTVVSKKLGPAWNGRISLQRLPDGFELRAAPGEPIRIGPPFLQRHIFTDDTLMTLLRLRPKIRAREIGFTQKYGSSANGWVYDDDNARIETPAGVISSAILGMFQEGVFYWATQVSGLSKKSLQPVKLLALTQNSPAVLDIGQVPVLNASLLCPYTWIVAERIDAQAVIPFPYQERNCLVVAAVDSI